MKIPAIYPIIDAQIRRHSLEFLMAEVAAAGVQWVQLRDKTANSRQFFAEAQTFVELAQRHGLKGIINDRTDIAWLAGAAGVHLGQEDLPVKHARKILGEHIIVGCSTHNLRQALEAEAGPADYVAIGPVFATTSKENPDPVVTQDELSEIRRRVKKPLVAIGGINSENAADLFRLGIDSVAVIRDILCADDIRKKIAHFIALHHAQTGLS